VVKILFTEIQNKLSDHDFFKYLGLLPYSHQQKILKYKRWEDSHASLAGKLLLKKGLSSLGRENDLQKIRVTSYGRPFVEGAVDFNISHSGRYVVCAFSKTGRIGIDIEEVKPVLLENFKSICTDTEWEQIQFSEDRNLEFFLLWTMKESTVKAIGRGLSIPLKDIEIIKNVVQIEGGWYLQRVDLAKNYICYISTDRKEFTLEIEKVDFGIF